jgi:16S rRNA (uracil1498-N3)-methyltransferase
MMSGLASADVAAHALVADVAYPELTPADRHHLERVLRLRVGTEISVGDGAGSWRTVRLNLGLEPTGPVVIEPRRQDPVTLAFALTKADKPELVVQKVTELGVEHIVLFHAARSVVRWPGDRVAHHLERLRRVVDAAVCQSRQAWSPTVTFDGEFNVVARRPGAALAAAEGGVYNAERHSVLVVGPEGGWSPEERSFRLPEVSFGPSILRAETAAVTAAAVACWRRYYPL